MINPIIEMLITEDNKENNVNTQNNNQQPENKDIKDNNQKNKDVNKEQNSKNNTNNDEQNNKNKQDAENKNKEISITNVVIPDEKRFSEYTKLRVFNIIKRQLELVSQYYNNRKKVKLVILTKFKNENEYIAEADVELNLPDNLKDIQDLRIEIANNDLEKVIDKDINTNTFRKLLEQSRDGYIVIGNNDLGNNTNNSENNVQNNDNNKVKYVSFRDVNIPKSDKIDTNLKSHVLDAIRRQLELVSHYYNNWKKVKLVIYTRLKDEDHDDYIATGNAVLNLPDNLKNIQELKIKINVDLEHILYSGGINTDAFKKLLEQSKDGYIVISGDDLNRKVERNSIKKVDYDIEFRHVVLPKSKRINEFTKSQILMSFKKPLSIASRFYSNDNKKNVRLVILTKFKNEIEYIATAEVELNLPDHLKNIQDLKIEIANNALEGAAIDIDARTLMQLLNKSEDGYIFIKNENLGTKGKLANKLSGLLIAIIVIFLLFAIAISSLHHAGFIGSTIKEIIDHFHNQVPKNVTITQKIDHYALYGIAATVVLAFLIKLFRIKRNINTKQEETMIKEYLKNYDLMLEFMQFKNNYVNKQYITEMDSFSISDMPKAIIEFIKLHSQGILQTFSAYYNSVSAHLFQNVTSSISVFLGVLIIGLAVTAFAVTIISPNNQNISTYLKGVLLTAMVGIVMLFVLYNLVTGHSMSSFNPPELLKSLKHFIQANMHTIFSNTGLSIIYGLAGATIIALIYTLLKNAFSASIKDVRQIPSN